ncbi:MAG: LPS translocon maturation chaperone LptM [Brachymonas sp.]
MSTSVVSLMRSHAASILCRAFSARSRYSRSVITIPGMLKSRFIVKNAAALALAVLLSACGQKGDLYLPTEPEAAHRAPLPRTLLPAHPRTQPASQATAPLLPASAAQQP